MKEFNVTLPWPSHELSPNFRGHWVLVSKKKKEFRQAARLLSMAAGAKAFAQDHIAGEKLNVQSLFYPPSKRHYDGDNANASAKALYDGIADALGIDDRWFRIQYELMPTIGGYVKVTITRNEAA